MLELKRSQTGISNLLIDFIYSATFLSNLYQHGQRPIIMQDFNPSQPFMEELNPEDFPGLIKQYLMHHQPDTSYDTAVVGTIFIFIFSCLIDMCVCLRPQGKKIHLNICLLYLLARKDDSDLIFSHLVLLSKMHEIGKLKANFDIHFKFRSQLIKDTPDLPEQKFMDYFKPFHTKVSAPKKLIVASCSDLFINDLFECFNGEYSNYPPLSFNLSKYSGSVKKLKPEIQDYFIDCLCNLADFIISKSNLSCDGVYYTDMTFIDYTTSPDKIFANSQFHLCNNESDINIIRIASYLALIDFRDFVSEKDIILAKTLYQVSCCSGQKTPRQKTNHSSDSGISPADVFDAVKTICKEKGCCTTRDIYQFFYGHIKQEDLHHALELLSIKKLGLIEKKIKKSGKGRPATLYSATLFN
ncbi:hypothetical protein M3P05_05480 [Sansalvadorimonas sp. 2012CJ34-2]|uniref:Uncharacterized protein n=1 Tax=Parendozoicomonas callyspongiae TaxID=2942213 RepID=A0ABT0PDE8_9GAMM|nr:hypothetical protein [Sansalvadorimonas sp. 2012CJ34-2]MCL6269397.1 hypothetical protein [Sansalvadorimonas sp. 2012CJ34-2]